MNRLKGKVALVTGSTQGLGEGIARKFAAEGAQLVIHGRSEDKGRRVAAELEAMGAAAVFIRADIGNKAQCRELIEKAAGHYGRLDILVNNAQSVPSLQEAENYEDSKLDEALSSGLYASLWAGQAALPWFRKAGGGRIVNFASINGVFGSKFGVAYNATKEAVRGLTRTLANEWGRDNVTVNAVMPSGLSPAYEAFYEGDDAKFRAVAKLNPMRRHGRAEEDIGSAVLGFVVDSSRYITGQSLFIDGGANLMGLPQLHESGTRFQ